MGTFYTIGATKESIVKELIQPFNTTKGLTCCVLHHSVVGNELWMVLHTLGDLLQG